MSSVQFSGCSSSYCASLVLELHLLTSPLLLASDVEKGKDTSVLRNGVEEDVEENILDCKKRLEVYLKFAQVFSPSRPYEALSWTKGIEYEKNIQQL